MKIDSVNDLNKKFELQSVKHILSGSQNSRFKVKNLKYNIFNRKKSPLYKFRLKKNSEFISKILE